MFAFGATPKGWLDCDGRSLQIVKYTAMFALLGTRFGGDGRVNFCLPDLCGCAPLGAGAGAGLTERQLGQRLGERTFALFTNHFPSHSHRVMGMNDKAAHQETSAADMLLANSTAGSEKKPLATNGYSSDIEHCVTLGEGSLSYYNSEEASHNNMQPYLALRFCIAHEGVYPPRSAE